MSLDGGHGQHLEFEINQSAPDAVSTAVFAFGESDRLRPSFIRVNVAKVPDHCCRYLQRTPESPKLLNDNCRGHEARSYVASA